MQPMKRTIYENRYHLTAIALAIIFAGTISYLNIQKYHTFQLIGSDVDRFTQAIWSVGQGKLLYTSISDESILGNHFSPYMALLAPFLWLWGDARILFVIQALGIALTGIMFYIILQKERPWLALLFLAIFYLNPNLHHIALYELRRITLAMPFLALMVVAVHQKNWRYLIIGTIGALLCKEDVGILVFMMGFVLFFIKRHRKVGLLFSLLGAIWFVASVQWLLPILAQRTSYTQINYFAEWGDSLPAIVLNMLKQPIAVLAKMFDQNSLQALFRLFLPVAFVSPLLGFEYLLICLPLLGLMLLSSNPSMHSLQLWYLAPIIPFVYGAVAIGLTRLPYRLSKITMVILFSMAVVTYRLYSPLPFGKAFEPFRYKTTVKQQQIWQALAEIPTTASVAAQVPFTTQLATRAILHLYPWVSETDQADYIVLDASLNPYPLSSHDLYWSIANSVADPAIVVKAQVDNFYILSTIDDPLPSIPLNLTAEESIHLEKAEIAIASPDGAFLPVINTLQPNHKLRITLYWLALQDVTQERTVSVRLQDSLGNILAQQDTLPSESSRPTSWWKTGWYFRDVYYLDTPHEIPQGDLFLRVLLYDTYSFEHVPFENHEEVTLFTFVDNP